LRDDAFLAVADFFWGDVAFFFSTARFDLLVPDPPEAAGALFLAMIRPPVCVWHIAPACTDTSLTRGRPGSSLKSAGKPRAARLARGSPASRSAAR
jgi:hypothetical protein